MTTHRTPEERRRQILEATGRVFLREGVGGITMIAVADEAGISRRLLYDHVADRRTLLLDFFFETLAEGVAPATSPDDRLADRPGDALRGVFATILALGPQQRSLLELLRTNDPVPDLDLVRATFEQHLMARWRSYELFVGLSDERLLVLTRLMVDTVLDLTAAVLRGVLAEADAVELTVALGTTALDGMLAAD